MTLSAWKRRATSDYRSDGRVYLLWGESTQSFKIGWTGKPSVDDRALVIQNHSPVAIRILGALQGGIREERALHQELAAYRTHGEWFRLPEEIVWRLLEMFGADPATAN